MKLLTIIILTTTLFFIASCTEEIPVDSGTDTDSGTTSGTDTDTDSGTDTDTDIMALVPPTKVNVLSSTDAAAKIIDFSPFIAAFSDPNTDYSNFDTTYFAGVDNFRELEDAEYYLCALRYAGGALANNNGYNFRVDLNLCNVDDPGYIEGVATANRIDGNSDQGYQFFFEVFYPKQYFNASSTDTSYTSINGAVIAELTVEAEPSGATDIGSFELSMFALIEGSALSPGTITSSINIQGSTSAGETEIYFGRRDLVAGSEDPTVIYDFLARRNSSGDGSIYSSGTIGGNTLVENFGAFNDNFVLTKQGDLNSVCLNRSSTNTYVLSYRLFDAVTGAQITTTENIDLQFVLADSDSDDTNTIDATWYGFGENGYLSVPLTGTGTSTTAEVTLPAGLVSTNGSYVVKPDFVLTTLESSDDTAQCDDAGLSIGTGQTFPTFTHSTLSSDVRPVLGDDALNVLNGLIE